MIRRARSIPLLLVIVVAACGRRGAVDPHLDRAYPDKLSEWKLFRATRPALKPNDGVVVYEVNTPLFSDYARKYRTLWMPPGTAAEYRAVGVFSFPIGTVVTKTFSFPVKDGSQRLIETRLLVRQRSGWVTLPYVWNREQTDAVLDTSPMPVQVRWMDNSGREQVNDYDIPNVNQCSLCHEDGMPLGLTARSLNRQNQLDQWIRTGYLKGAPGFDSVPRGTVWNDADAGSIEQRAREYIQVNCGTCHRSGTRAKPLDMRNTPEILRRMESTDPEKRMPSIGHTVVDREAVELMRQWIAAGTE